MWCKERESSYQAAGSHGDAKHGRKDEGRVRSDGGYCHEVPTRMRGATASNDDARRAGLRSQSATVGMDGRNDDENVNSNGDDAV